jgi:hypothetical protein
MGFMWVFAWICSFKEIKITTEDDDFIIIPPKVVLLLYSCIFIK